MADEDAITLAPHRKTRPAGEVRPVSDKGTIDVWGLIRSLASMAVIFIALSMLIAVLSVAFAVGC